MQQKEEISSQPQFLAMKISSNRPTPSKIGFTPVGRGECLHNGVSGWYARLDRTLDDRVAQINIWIKAWSNSLTARKPVAALLPLDWPTLPANLLTDPGHVLDHLLARFDAETDGRSPRGAHPTPPRLADAIIKSEMLEPAIIQVEDQINPKMPLDALPPGFRAHLDKFNLSSIVEEPNTSIYDQAKEDVENKIRTISGVPLPIADSACGGGLFVSRLLRFHSESLQGQEKDLIENDTRLLLKNLQLVDLDSTIVATARKRIHLEAVRHGLATIGESVPGKLSENEVFEILADRIKSCDSLQEDWPWQEKPRLMITNPPWLRIKDRFRGHKDGSKLRRELGEQLRELVDENGVPRFSTMRGNVNLYRLFIERGLQILQPGGTLRLIAPDSLLREQSSAPLRELMVKSNTWHNIWAIEEANLLFPGITQGAVVISVSSGGVTSSLAVHGPIKRNDLIREGNGLASKVQSFDLDLGRWLKWTKGTWAVPRLPVNSYDRKAILKIIDDLAKNPRLGDKDHWLVRGGDNVRVRVGEIDQTSHSSSIQTWVKGRKSRPFIRGVHFTEDENRIYIHHPAFDSSIPSRAAERQLSMWTGSLNIYHGPRLACQAIVNAKQQRRLRWALIDEGSVLGNSVNHIELSKASEEFLTLHKSSLKEGLSWLCNLLNEEKLDIWARCWAANNNVNNYELEMLPLIEENVAVHAIAKIV